MPHRYLFAVLLLAAPCLAHAQMPTGSVGIGTTAPDASAALDIVSSSKGLLLPRVAAATSIASPAPGLLVYQTGAPAGFYYNSGTADATSWLRLATGSGPGDNLGNHTATRNLDLAGYQLVSGGGRGLALTSGGNVGIGTSAPTSTLHIVGSVAASIRVAGNGNTLRDTDYTVLVVGNVRLPEPGPANTGRFYLLLNVGTDIAIVSGTLRDASSTETLRHVILGAGAYTNGFTVQSDGTQWWILNRW